MQYLEIERDYDHRFTGIKRYDRQAEKAAKETSQALALMNGTLEQVRVAEKIQRDADRNARIARQIFESHQAVVAPEAYLFIVSPPKFGAYEFTLTKSRRRSCPDNDIVEQKNPVPTDEQNPDASFIANRVMAVQDDEEFPFRAAYDPSKKDDIRFDFQIIALNGRERISLTPVDLASELNLVNSPVPKKEVG